METQKGLSATNRNRSIVWSAVGVALIVLSIYVLSAQGRIDIIDGQLRYEVARNILHEGRPILRDPVMTALRMSGVPGNGGYVYSFYCFAGSVFAVPLMWIGDLIGGGNGETERFLFSFTSAIFGALTAAVLYLFYIDLGISRKRAFWWTLISAFATMIWPASTSTFDNAQHAFFALFAVFLAYRSASRNSGALAVAAGVVAGVMINYQEYFVILMPTLAIATLCWQPFIRRTAASEGKDATASSTTGISVTDRFFGILTTIKSLCMGQGKEAEARKRYLLFVMASWSGLILFCLYNYARFGSFLKSGKLELVGEGHPSYLGDFSVGLMGLLLSPGKSIFLYSPAIILGIIGIKRLWRIAPQLGWAIAISSLVLLGFLSNILFFGGDWCWGPRYLVVLLPLWSLAFPFLPLGKMYRGLAILIVALGLGIQLMALSVDHQRFFLERNLPGHFWADEPGFYFSNSALFARPAEMLSLKNAPPNTAMQFNPSPYKESVTYCVLGVTPTAGSPLSSWMRKFQVFYLPRPWPLWMQHVDNEHRPVNLNAWIIGLLLIGASGGLCVFVGLRKTVDQTSQSDFAIPLDEPIKSFMP